MERVREQCSRREERLVGRPVGRSVGWRYAGIWSGRVPDAEGKMLARDKQERMR